MSGKCMGLLVSNPEVFIRTEADEYLKSPAAAQEPDIQMYVETEVNLKIGEFTAVELENLGGCRKRSRAGGDQPGTHQLHWGD